MPALKNYSTTRNCTKSSNGLSLCLPTADVLWTTVGPPMLLNNLSPWFTPWSGPLVKHSAHESPCAWAVWRKPKAPFQGGAQEQLWGWTALEMAEQGWGYGSFVSSCPTPPRLSSCPQTPLVCPHHTPQQASYLWHNAIRTPVSQAAKQPSHYLRRFELKPQKYNYGRRATGASDPGQVLCSTNTASSLQRCVIWRGVDAYIRIAPWGRSFSSTDCFKQVFFIAHCLSCSSYSFNIFWAFQTACSGLKRFPYKATASYSSCHLFHKTST